VNLVLFEAAEVSVPLARSDRRAEHVLKVLRRQPGESFDVGLINGPRGKATIAELSDEGLKLQFVWSDPPAPADPITLIIGLPRPQTARDILRDATTLGVAALHFVRCEKAEASYAHSSLWTSGEWRRHVLAGAEQAFDTRIPDVTHGLPLGDVVAKLPPASTRLALDNYESPLPLGDWPMAADQPIVLAIGPERGWSNAERELLRMRCFGLAHLGSRVLRTETAVIASLAIVRAQLGWLR
jgi:16S rRNA (uracil1498-N3)-methyltransferase